MTDLRDHNILAIVPTYNEIRSLPDTVARLRAAVPKAHVLIVDDDSPDGTGSLADHLADTDPRVSVMHRVAKTGLADAYLAGFDWGMRAGFSVLVEMDADGSHAPEQLPRLLAALDSADMVLGSRWVAGGSVSDWSRHREALSRAANTYVRLALGTRLRDATGGFRAYRREVLEHVLRDGIDSRGYCFQIDLAYRAERAGFLVVEVPITFSERTFGSSKMTSGVIGEALRQVTRWAITDRCERARNLVVRGSQATIHHRKVHPVRSLADLSPNST